MPQKNVRLNFYNTVQDKKKLQRRPEKLSILMAVLYLSVSAHHQKRQQAEGYAHEVGLHVAGAEAADVEQPLQQLRAHSQQHGQQQTRP